MMEMGKAEEEPGLLSGMVKCYFVAVIESLATGNLFNSAI
jgi:hypothetical protein